jgi:hypothetical protein
MRVRPIEHHRTGVPGVIRGARTTRGAWARSAPRPAHTPSARSSAQQPLQPPRAQTPAAPRGMRPGSARGGLGQRRGYSTSSSCFPRPGAAPSSAANPPRCGTRKPTDTVMQSPPSATPSCAQRGGRYSMSPGSSTHSCSGSKCCKILHGKSGRKRKSRWWPMRQRRRPLACNKKTRRSCRSGARRPPPSLAHEIITSSSRTSRHEAKALHQRVHRVVVQIDALHQQRPARLAQRAARRAHRGVPRTSKRPVPATAHVCAGVGPRPGAAPRRATPHPRARPGRTVRYATANGRKPGMACRINNGRRCQWRRMNCRGDSPAQERQRLVERVGGRLGRGVGGSRGTSHGTIVR